MYILIILIFISYNLKSQVQWEKETRPASLISKYTCNNGYAGASFVDINSDGYLDIFMAPEYYYINNKKGYYSFVYKLPFFPQNTFSGNSWADINNDGYIDCAIASSPSGFFLNNGKGELINYTTELPILDHYNSFGCAIGNINNDEKLDIIYTHAEGFHKFPNPCRIYEQKDELTFELNYDYEFTGLRNTYTNAYWSDYDLDGDLDLFIASGKANGESDFDYCYRNNFIETGNDTLIRMTEEQFAIDKQDGQCYNFIDIDNDNDLDLCITNYYGAKTRLYKNNNGNYESIETPFTNYNTNLANCWGDYDNDGDLDVIITNDNDSTKLFINNGSGEFSFDDYGYISSRVSSLVNGDYDNDGDLDLILNGVGNNGSDEACGLYKNKLQNEYNWVNIKLEGSKSNKSAIGSRIQLKSRINGKLITQLRELNAQNSFLGQNDIRVHFGLKNSQIIESLKIYWPSGEISEYSNLIVNEFYKITENDNIQVLSTEKEELSIDFYPNPTNEYLMIRNFETYYNSDFKIYDINGRIILLGNLSSNEIDVSALNCGTYILKIEKDNEITTKKFIII